LDISISALAPITVNFNRRITLHVMIDSKIQKNFVMLRESIKDKNYIHEELYFNIDEITLQIADIFCQF
jgi:hypothetical protein